MKNISLWANKNKNIARGLIVTIKITLAFMAYYVGNQLYEMGISIPFILLNVIGVISVCAAIFYPSKKLNQSSKHTIYVKQKSCDFILAACTFIAIVTVVNNRDAVQPPLPFAFASFIKTHPPKAEEILASLSYRDKSSLSRVEKRVLKKEFYKQVKVYAIAKVNGDKEKANSTLPIILTIIAAIGLSILLAGLVCNLSCNGAEAAAAIVGVLGAVGIIWGTVVLIKHLSRKSKK